jgi:hypothetical protein
MPFLLPLRNDPESYVRMAVCQLLYVFGGDVATAALVSVLQKDSDPQVRGMAAGILGAVGTPEAIPALIAAMDSDHEYDMHGHSPSSCSASALDRMLGTDETCLHVTASLCKLKPGKPDLHRLKQLAQEKYDRWSK